MQNNDTENTLAGLKIAMIGAAYPYRGGIAHFIAKMYRDLEKDHEIKVITFTRQYPEFLFPGKTQFTDEQGAEIPTTRSIDSIWPLSWWRTCRMIRHWHPDILVFHYWMSFFAPAYGMIARYLKKRGIRIVAIAHNAKSHEKRPAEAMLARFFFKACDGILVLSKSVHTDLIDLDIEKPIIQTGHPVYDIFGPPVSQKAARQALGFSFEERLLLFFGFIRRYKGLQTLLKAMPLVLKELKLKLIVAGEFYGDKQEYFDIVKQGGIEKEVVFYDDYIPEDKVALYFCAADLVVQPYVSASQSGVAQIAYHFEKPIIVTDVGGLAEIVPHNKAGFVVPPENPAELARAIVTFFRDHKADELVEGVIQEKKRYTWQHLYDSMSALLKKIS
jgi:glycosyltransferase involved in cell wall biosynthesis